MTTALARKIRSTRRRRRTKLRMEASITAWVRITTVSWTHIQWKSFQSSSHRSTPTSSRQQAKSSTPTEMSSKSSIKRKKSSLANWARKERSEARPWNNKQVHVRDLEDKLPSGRQAHENGILIKRRKVWKVHWSEWVRVAEPAAVAQRLREAENEIALSYPLKCSGKSDIRMSLYVLFTIPWLK